MSVTLSIICRIWWCAIPRQSDFALINLYDRAVAGRIRAWRTTRKGRGGLAAALSVDRKTFELRYSVSKIPSEPVVQADGEQVQPARHGDGIGRKEAGVVHIV